MKYIFQTIIKKIIIGIRRIFSHRCHAIVQKQKDKLVFPQHPVIVLNIINRRTVFCCLRIESGSRLFFCLHSYLPTPVLIIITPNYRLKYTEKALRTRSLYLPFTAKPLRCDHVARAEPILLWSPLYFKTNT